MSGSPRRQTAVWSQSNGLKRKNAIGEFGEMKMQASTRAGAVAQGAVEGLATASERFPALMRVAGVPSINWQLHKPQGGKHG